MSRAEIASVALLQSIGRPLSYSLPTGDRPEVGSLVEVPLKTAKAQGIVVAIRAEETIPDHLTLKEIGRILKPSALSLQLLRLAQWMSAYYCCRLDQVLKCFLPSATRQQQRERSALVVARKLTIRQLRQWCQEHRARWPKRAAVLDALLRVKGNVPLSELMRVAGVTKSPIESLAAGGLIAIDKCRLEVAAFEHEYFPTKAKALNSEQAIALKHLTSSIESGAYRRHLLFGVTGSGKTEVYLQAIAEVLARGKKVLILVPEISLTPQTVERYRSRFQHNVAVVHSQITPARRAKLWQEMSEGKIDVAIGARSAAFCPLHPLGLIIVDEEHESSYKSEQSPYYHAREVLDQRAHIEGAVLLLASATPSLESHHRAKGAPGELLTLTARAANAVLPEISLVDMRADSEQAGTPLLSRALLEELKLRQVRGEQSLLFLNRRGYRAGLFCQNCQHSLQCPHCDLALTYHLEGKSLRCHVCGLTRPLERQCPTCRGELTFRGWGTQHVELALRRLLPTLRVMRIDRDTTAGEGVLAKMLRGFGSGKADALIGTQMIGKGHHFPAVTLVGILNPDHGLHVPDFRASERLFQTLVQVSGRAGRARLGGKVLIQTRRPDLEIFSLATKGDFEAFYRGELTSRDLFGYPPCNHLIKCLARGTDDEATRQLIEEYHAKCATAFPPQVLLSPPLPAPRARLQDQHRYQFIVKAPSVLPVTRELHAVTLKMRIPRSVSLMIDVDPHNLS